MNISKQIQTIQGMQDRYVTLQSNIQQRVRNITKPVETEIRRRLKAEFPGTSVYMLCAFQCGCLSNRWTPQVFIYRINDLTYSPDGYWYDHKLEVADADADKHQPPVPTRRFLAFLKSLSDEIGVKISLVRQRPCWLGEHNEESPMREEIFVTSCAK